MKLTQNLIKNNTHYKNNKIINVKSLILHSVGCSQPNPDVFVRLWNTPDVIYLTQIVIGAEKAYEVLPCTQTSGKAMFCYHTGSINGYSIGAEMTEPSTIKYTGGATWIDLDPAKTKAHVLATYKNAVDIFAQLCKFHKLNPLNDGVILSHSECHKRGIGTNHGDVEHIWNKFGLTMNKFRKDVSIAMGNVIVDTNDKEYNSKFNKGDIVKIAYNATYYNGKSIPVWVKNQNWIISSINGDRAVIDKNEFGTSSINSSIHTKFLSHMGTKSTEFMVKVDIDNLNIRTGPGTNYPRFKYIPRGVYTIIEVNNNWGKLKSKQTFKGHHVDGWISLRYVKKV